MYTLSKTVLMLILLTACAPAMAQTTKPEEAGSISGRVTIGGKGVIHAVMLLYGAEGIRNSPLTKATTDQDGRYIFTNVAAGQYSVRPITTAYVSQEITHLGKAIAVDPGEAVDNVNFDLVRGGVITGRITDPQGRPLIGEPIQVLSADSNRNWMLGDYAPDTTTDDRGIYRVFGLPAGRYVVAAGQEVGSSQRIENIARAHYKRTYYPDAVEQGRAKVIEVITGGEMSGVDIALSRAGKRYSAAGRLIDATTGKPVANTWISHGSVAPDGKPSMRGGPALRSDAQGNFRLQGLLPGRYVTFVRDWETEGYADPVQFEVADKDVTGLELRLKSGVTINGLITLAGADNPAASAQLGKVQIYAQPTSGEMAIGGAVYTLKINPDGSFRLAGLTPGRLDLSLPSGGANKNFSIIQVEKDGVPQTGGVTISPGDQAVNVKIALGYGSGTVRGQVNGELPKGAQIWVVILPAGQPNVISNVTRSGQADAHGRFLFEGLATGEYEVSATVYLMQGGSNMQVLKRLSEKVSVTSGSESQVAWTVNLAPDKKEDR